MSPGNSQTAACSMPPPHAPVRNTDDSETESESEVGVVSELESQPDQEYEYMIQNQLGLPEYRDWLYSSPPPVDANISNKLNIRNTDDSVTQSKNEIGVVSELESQPGQAFEYVVENKPGSPEYQHIRSSPPPVDANISNKLNSTYKVQISGNEGNETMNTDIILSLGSEKNTKIKVKVENSYHSNPTININIEQVHLRGKRHERGIEDFEGATNIHVQVKKIKK